MESKTIFDIPAEVLSHDVFKHLELNDLLRLRRVCKPMKALANDSIRLYRKSKNNTAFGIFFGEKHEVKAGTVGAEAATPADVLKMDLEIPNKNFVFMFGVEWKKNPKNLFESDNLRTFLAKYGNQIEELKLDTMSAPLEPEELHFYESLPNLKRLTVRSIDAFKVSVKLNLESITFAFPSTFKNLTHLNVDIYKRSSGLPTSAPKGDYILSLLEYCEKLEHYGVPKEHVCHRDDPTMAYMIPETRVSNLLLVKDMIKKSGSGGWPNLKICDMSNFSGDVNHYLLSNFIEFCRVASHHGVKLRSIEANLLLLLRSRDLYEEVAKVILSLRNLEGNLVKFELPSLETLVITDSSACTIMNEDAEEQISGKPQWPKLKLLGLRVTSRKMADGQRCSALLDFLFEDILRPALEGLSLNFLESRKELEGSKKSGKPLPAPSTNHIVSSCFNIKKLSINGWPGTNKAICTLWTGLVNLEELCLMDCIGLGNVAFVGEDVDNPVFLKLGSLKNLHLRNVDKMPKITDTVFRLVFRHIKLKQFHLSSSSNEKPLKSITEKGIRELLTGAFAETIEKFTLKDITLDGVNSDGMSNLLQEFRSSFML